MDEGEAKQLLAAIHDDTPYTSRLEFLSLMAAFVRVYKEEVSRPEFGKSRPILDKIAGLCSPGSVEYLFNHQNWLASQTKGFCLYHSSGTSSNEGLHYTLNSASDEVTQIHESSLKHWLKIMHHRLLTLHEAAR